MKKIKVNNKVIGGDETFIIADIGSNHKQDLALAKESIDAAHESGADAIKFQSIQLNKLYYNPDVKTTEFIKKLEFPEEWHFELNEYCKKKDILFFSSPTYMDAVDLLEQINVPIYKLASAQIGTFPQIVEKVAKLNKPTIFSTGISSISEILNAVEIFEKANNDNYMILHCNSIYPTPPERVNLQMMKTYESLFHHPVGFSDHTIGTHISNTAVCMGAKIIEKHFTLDRKIDAPDSNEFASDPREFKQLVTQIRDTESALKVIGNRMGIEKEEKSFRDSILYRVVSKCSILKGEQLTSRNIEFLRSPEGFDCRDFFEKKCFQIKI